MGPHRGETTKLAEVGRPKAGRRDNFEAFPTRIQPKVRPGSPISGPEALLRNVGYLMCLLRVRRQLQHSTGISSPNFT